MIDALLKFLSSLVDPKKGTPVTMLIMIAAAFFIQLFYLSYEHQKYSQELSKCIAREAQTETDCVRIYYKCSQETTWLDFLLSEK